MGLWAPWSSCRGPCSLQRSWTKWPLRIPSNSNGYMILWNDDWLHPMIWIKSYFISSLAWMKDEKQIDAARLGVQQCSTVCKWTCVYIHQLCSSLIMRNTRFRPMQWPSGESISTANPPAQEMIISTAFDFLALWTKNCVFSWDWHMLPKTQLLPRIISTVFSYVTKCPLLQNQVLHPGELMVSGCLQLCCILSW